MREIRIDASIDCPKIQSNGTICRPLQKPCLFNIDLDPCEQNNLADQ